MKSLFSKKHILTLFIWGAIFSIAWVGCENESIEAVSSLETQWAGQWQVTSFQHDGAEIKGEIVLSSKLFFRSSLSDSKGDFEWSIVYHDKDASENITGSYEIDESNDEITFTGDKGKLLKLHFSQQDNQLELSGMLDDVPLLLKAQSVK